MTSRAKFQAIFEPYSLIVLPASAITWEISLGKIASSGISFDALLPFVVQFPYYLFLL
jgi:hypothetical protein